MDETSFAGTLLAYDYPSNSFNSFCVGETDFPCEFLEKANLLFFEGRRRMSAFLNSEGVYKASLCRRPLNPEEIMTIGHLTYLLHGQRRYLERADSFAARKIGSAACVAGDIARKMVCVAALVGLAALPAIFGHVAMVALTGAIVSAATPHTSLGRIGRLAGDLAEGALSIAALIHFGAVPALMRYSAMAGAIAGGCTRALFNYANGFRFAHS